METFEWKMSSEEGNEENTFHSVFEAPFIAFFVVQSSKRRRKLLRFLFFIGAKNDTEQGNEWLVFFRTTQIFLLFKQRRAIAITHYSSHTNPHKYMYPIIYYHSSYFSFAHWFPTIYLHLLLEADYPTDFYHSQNSLYFLNKKIHFLFVVLPSKDPLRKTNPICDPMAPCANFCSAAKQWFGYEIGI